MIINSKYHAIFYESSKIFNQILALKKDRSLASSPQETNLGFFFAFF